MKNITTLAFMILLFSCNQSDSTKETESKKIDSSKKEQVIDTSKKETGTVINNKIDSSSILLKTADEIMTAVKTKDILKFASFVHPTKGFVFGDKPRSAAELIKFGKEKKTITVDDQRDGSIRKVTLEQYLGETYKVDFLKLATKSINHLHRGADAGIPADQLNKQEVSKDHDIVEYFFKGTPNNGMDWRALRLYFEWKDNVPYLIEFIQDGWEP